MKCCLRRLSSRPARPVSKITTSPVVAVGIGVINCKMKKAMKKITYLLIAAFTLVSVASCVKEMTPEVAPESGVTGQVFTVSLPAETRTALAIRKTVWAEGDSLWVSNGVESEAVVVPSSAWGGKSFDFATKTVKTSEENPKIWVVYPYTAAAGVTDSKVNVIIPSQQDGEFASANICAAESWGYNIPLRNVTALMKVTIPETDIPIFMISAAAANDNPLTGTCSVDFSGDAPVLTPISSISSVSMQVDGVFGEFYISVIPGTYDPGFKLTAATVDFEHASETKVSTVANEVKINQIVNIGTIGTDLKPLEGDGTAANPYLIENLGHLIALAGAVISGGVDDEGMSTGRSFAGEYIKVVEDIEGVTTPIGIDDEEIGYRPFCGDFDGGGHTIKLSINGSYDLGLFGIVGAGANLHDIQLEGSVTGSSVYVGALAGEILVKEDKAVTVSNVTSKAVVTGKQYVGGLAGIAKFSIPDPTDPSKTVLPTVRNCFENCKNFGKVTGQNSVGGLVGYSYYGKITDSQNHGVIQSVATKATPMFDPALNGYLSGGNLDGSYNNGTGGVVGWAQNSVLENLVNDAEVSAFCKVGGIAGVTYWTNVDGLTNSGNVTGTGYIDPRNIAGQQYPGYGSAAGGVIGWVYTAGTIKNCKNSGAVKGKTGIGGIAGFAGTDQNNKPTFMDLENTGDITASQPAGTTLPHGIWGHNAGTGGIIGSFVRWGPKQSVSVTNCKNSGKVYSPSVNAGGIVGLMHDCGNGLKPTYSYVDNCFNEGDVTVGQCWAGGIVGYSFSRYVGRLVIRNCANQGKITGSRPSGNGTVAGGILGGVGANDTSRREAADHLWVYNNYNVGEVLYSNLALTVPYVGGIIGNAWGTSRIKNNYNAGYVGPADHSEPVAAALKYLGAVAGYQYKSYLTNNYASNDILNGQMVGTDGAPADATVLTYNPASGELSGTVKIGDEVYVYLLEALNAWIGESTDYVPWVDGENGPVFENN